MCASGMMLVCYLVPCTSERMNVGSWRARGGARGLLWTSLSYRGMCPGLRGRLPLRPVPVTPPGPRTRRCERGGVWCSGVCPTAPQHAACGVWRESGEDSDRARGRRPEAERIAVIRRCIPIAGAGRGRGRHDDRVTENDATTAVSCLTVLQAKPDVIMCEPRCASSGIGVV